MFSEAGSYFGPGVENDREANRNHKQLTFLRCRKCFDVTHNNL